eukprot:ANDGO_02098.mRNA.1 Crystal protein
MTAFLPQRALLVGAVALLLVSGVLCGPVVTVDSGSLEGVVDATTGSDMFLGIPFAAPPVDALRWANPQPVAPWSGVRQAVSYGAGCPQSCDQPPGTCPTVQSEDCLFVNVFVPPSDGSGQLLPVYAFLPGGRFLQGGGSSPFYSGAHLAARSKAVVVTIAYRLGALGFMASKSDTQGQADLIGNYGLEDQRFALKWIQRNIKSFGGDASRVTLGGESAGGTSIAVHLTSPKSKGLFQAVIIESNPFALPLKTVSENFEYADRLAKHVGCKPADIECMRKVNTTMFVEYQGKCAPEIPVVHTLRTVYAFSPSIDGTDNVPGQPLAVLQTKGPVDSSVPVLIGTNADEGTMFIFEGATFNVSKIEAEAFLVDLFGVVQTGRILKNYPIPSTEDRDTRDWLVTLCTNYMFACPSRNAAAQLAKAGNKIYMYEFAQALSFKGAWGPNFPFCEGHVCHGVELAYIFDTPNVGGYSFSDAELVLVDAMQTFWLNHVASGQPGSWKGTQWPQWDEQSDMLMILNTNPKSAQNVKHEDCNFWDTVGYLY